MMQKPSKWVLICEYSARAIQWMPIWQGLDAFQHFGNSMKVVSALEGLRLHLWTDWFCFYNPEAKGITHRLFYVSSLNTLWVSYPARRMKLRCSWIIVGVPLKTTTTTVKNWLVKDWSYYDRKGDDKRNLILKATSTMLSIWADCEYPFNSHIEAYGYNKRLHI